MLHELATGSEFARTITRAGRTHDHRPSVALPAPAPLRGPPRTMSSRARRSSAAEVVRPVALDELAALLVGVVRRVSAARASRRGGRFRPAGPSTRSSCTSRRAAVRGLAPGLYHFQPVPALPLAARAARLVAVRVRPRRPFSARHVGGARRRHRRLLALADQVRPARLSVRAARGGPSRPDDPARRHRSRLARASARRLLRPASRRARRCRRPRRGSGIRGRARRLALSMRTASALLALMPCTWVVLSLVLSPPHPDRRVPLPAAVAAGLAAGRARFGGRARVVSMSPGGLRTSPAARSVSRRRASRSSGWLRSNEELLWRRLVLGGLLPGGALAALAVSTLGFALAHRARPALHLGTGATFGGLYLATGALAAPVAAHWAYNALLLAGLRRDAPAPAAAGSGDSADRPPCARRASTRSRKRFGPQRRARPGRPSGSATARSSRSSARTGPASQRRSRSSSGFAARMRARRASSAAIHARPRRGGSSA